MDACIEHLGCLPSQLDLSNDQITELLTFHRIKRRAGNVCRDCVEESQKAEKTCFVCERTYTEKWGPRGQREDGGSDGFAEWLKERTPGQKGKTVEDASDGEKAEWKQKWLEAFKAKGGTVIE